MISREWLFQTWRLTVSLSWPISVQQALTTLMRSVDIVVAYVTTVGLADLYAQIPLRIGLALGAGAIVISNQDTCYGCWATIAAAGFVWGDWANLVVGMMVE